MQAFGMDELNEEPGVRDRSKHKRLMEAGQIFVRKTDKWVWNKAIISTLKRP